MQMKCLSTFKGHEHILGDKREGRRQTSLNEGGGVYKYTLPSYEGTEFCLVMKTNFAESLQPLINISFPKIVASGRGGTYIFLNTILCSTTVVRSIFP
jgi:hypothetical protein